MRPRVVLGVLKPDRIVPPDRVKTVAGPVQQLTEEERIGRASTHGQQLPEHVGLDLLRRSWSPQLGHALAIASAALAHAGCRLARGTAEVESRLAAEHEQIVGHGSGGLAAARSGPGAPPASAALSDLYPRAGVAEPA